MTICTEPDHPAVDGVPHICICLSNLSNTKYDATEDEVPPKRTSLTACPVFRYIGLSQLRQAAKHFAAVNLHLIHRSRPLGWAEKCGLGENGQLAGGFGASCVRCAFARTILGNLLLARRGTCAARPKESRHHDY